jgi:uncharacterized protein YggE
MKISLLMLAAFCLSSTSLPAQIAPRSPFVRASGDASVFVQPDQVKIDTTVTTQAGTAQDAAAQNAAQSAGLVAALNKLLGSGADIKTVNYYITPIYKSTQNGGSVLSGYSASNTVEVTLGTLSLAGSVIDTASQNGATSIGGLSFSLKDQEPARGQALRAATQQAMTHAQAMALAMSRSVGAVTSVEESTAVQYPIVAGVAGGVAAPAVPTSVTPGLIQVQASVVLQAELN